jgi:O-antigen ligase
MEAGRSVRPGRGSTGALAVLVLLVVLTPWPFGSAHPLATRVVSVMALVAAFVVVARGLRGDPAEVPAFPAWWVGGLLALAVLQLVPLPAGLHTMLAPGSAAVWHPAEPEAAGLLGAGPRPISIDPEATRRWLCLAVGLVTLAVQAAPALRHRRSALAAALVVGASALAVALYGMVARTLFGTRLYGLIPVPTIAPFGPFVSKNHFAGYVEMAALLALGLALGLADEARKSRGLLGWIDSPRAGRVVLAYGAAAVMALAILISLSRGGAVSLTAGGLALLLLRLTASARRRSRRPILLTLTLAAACAGLAFAVLPSEGRERVLSLVGIASESSGRFRLGVWRDTLSLVASSPVAGQGLGAFADALPPFERGADMRIEHAENDYLEMLAEGGALGFLLAMAAVVLAARGTVRGLAREGDRLRRGLGMGAAAGAGALLVHSGFDFNLRITSNAVLFALLAAWVLASAGSAESPSRTLVPRESGLFALGLAVTLGIALLTPPPVPVGQLEAIRAARASPTPLRLAQADAALAAHLRRRPGDAEAWLHLGWVRAARGERDEGAALARYAAQLDPQRRSITAGAEALSALARRR